MPSPTTNAIDTPVFHTCTHEVDFFINPDMASLLCKDLSMRPPQAKYSLPTDDTDYDEDDAAGFPRLGVSTQFDAWVHELLLSVRGVYTSQ